MDDGDNYSNYSILYMLKLSFSNFFFSMNFIIICFIAISRSSADIALIHNFSAENLRHETVCHNCKKEDDTGIDQYFP